MFWIFDSLFYYIGLLSVLTFVIPFLAAAYLFDKQNLKTKYETKNNSTTGEDNVTWAFVTGASSGIGRALTELLAEQGINVVMAALDDEMLKNVYPLMKEQYPNVQFRKVPVNLGGNDYMDVIQEACKDIRPSLIFNNAGFVMTGMFADAKLGAQMVNYNCNATAAIKITHYFAHQMLVNKQKGCICFTSSPAGMMPSPITVMYGTTKAMVTNFAASLAGELYADNIDVLVVHPSPVDTGFYAGNKHNVGAMHFFQKTATSPKTIAECFFKSVGRITVHEQGYFSFGMKMFLKVLDYDMLALIIHRMARTGGDLKNMLIKNRLKRMEEAKE